MNKKLMQIVSRSAAILRSQRWLGSGVYQQLDRIARIWLYDTDYVLQVAKRTKNVKESPPPASDYESEYPWTIGVIGDMFFNHESFIMACRDMKVAYKSIDIFASDWVKQVVESQCDGFVVWPSEYNQEWKQLHDERIRFLVQDLGRVVYPPYEALWLHGSKQRAQEYLHIHGYPHPRTWVFYLKTEALDFLQTAPLPLVLKLDIGASAHSVWIAHTRQEARRLVGKAFGRGLVGRRADAQTRQWGHILVQEYLPGIREWRMIRIGDSYFGHEKKRAGEFHSGSMKWGWGAPPEEALELLHRITETGGLGSMDMDVFETPDGHFLVNELQTVFGSFDSSQMYIDGVPGRYRRVDGRFVFEEGRFCWNACCNLRIADLMKELERVGGGAIERVPRDRP